MAAVIVSVSSRKVAEHLAGGRRCQCLGSAFLISSNCGARIKPAVTYAGDVFIAAARASADFLMFSHQYVGTAHFDDKRSMFESLDFFDGQVFDRRNLLRMQGYLDPASFRAIIEEFRTALENRLGDLDRSNRSRADIAAVSHDLLNFAGTLGLFELKAATERLAASARSGALGCELAIADVRAAGDRALLVLTDYIHAPNF